MLVLLSPMSSCSLNVDKHSKKYDGTNNKHRRDRHAGCIGIEKHQNFYNKIADRGNGAYKDKHPKQSYPKRYQ
jgi:hypothetical protein